jgi:hypothetical protein
MLEYSDNNNNYYYYNVVLDTSLIYIYVLSVLWIVTTEEW